MNYTKNTLAEYPFEIGEYTYGTPEIFWWEESVTLKIGRFCSIAEGVKIFLGGNHRTDWVTTYPFSAKEMTATWPTATEIVGHPTSKGDIIIGNDVWLGAHSSILSGISIGDGAVIGAHAVVTKDVPSYTIVAGNPAKIIRRRFSASQIELLLEIRWWDWEPEKIAHYLPLMCSPDIDRFLSESRKSGEIELRDQSAPQN